MFLLCGLFGCKVVVGVEFFSGGLIVGFGNELIFVVEECLLW